MAAKKNSNTGKNKKATDPKKRRSKSDKVRFIFGRDMSSDGMIGALKKMTKEMGMEFVPDKKHKKAKPIQKEITGGKRGGAQDLLRCVVTASIFTDRKKGHVMLSETESQEFFSGVVCLILCIILEIGASNLNQ